MYQKLIDDFISAQDAKRQEARGSDAGEWHPSSLTGCPRAAVYDYIDEPVSDEKAMRSIRIMDRGTQMHEVVQALLPEGARIEVKIDYAGVKGSCDALIPVPCPVCAMSPCSPQCETPGEYWYELHEYKSISPIGKKYMKGKPKPEHVKQVRIYHGCLRAMGYNLTDTVRIVYFDRDDWSVVEYEEPAWLDVEFHEFLGEIADLEDHVEAGTLPDRMPDDFWLCRYCDYRTTCKG